MSRPPSPCTGLCRIDPRTERCRGCKRSLDEITAWPKLSNSAQRALLAQLRRR